MIEARNLHKELGEFSLRGVDMQVDRGEYFVVLGPTGAGKTVLLECLAGLHRVDEGEVWLNGRPVTHLLPEQRNIGYVPQDYVLFPHLSLRENIAFSLTLTRQSAESVSHRVHELADLLHISHLLDRRPRTLSGGEQQRGALARALAPSPTVLLLDEPLSALDEGTRAELGGELSRLAQELNTTIIHVCHNFDEALELADRVGIMHHGRLHQVGTPAEVFRRPASRFVARFVGACNLFNVVRTEPERGRVVLEGGAVLTVAHVSASAVVATVRPEEVAVVPVGGASGGHPSSDDPENRLRSRIDRVDDRGRFMRLFLTGRVPLICILTRQAYLAAGIGPGQEVEACFPSASVHLLTA